MEFKDYFPLLKNNQDLIRSIAQKVCHNGCLLLSEVDGEHAGIAAFYANDYDTYKAFLSLLAVKDRFRRIGIGRALLESVQSISLAAGMRELILEVRCNNHQAVGFYKWLGFQPVEITDHSTLRLRKKIVNVE